MNARSLRMLAWSSLVAIGLGACASAPVNYYTLIPASSSQAGSNARVAEFAFDLLAINLPPQVDQPQLVVRQSGASMALVESERWIAPLADEVRDAIAADLVSAHGGQDLSSLPQGERDLIRIKIDLRRFDSEPGRVAAIDAAWSVRRVPGDSTALSCSSRISEPVSAGYDALVQGHQRALARLAAAIAVPATAMSKSLSSACPADAR